MDKYRRDLQREASKYGFEYSGKNGKDHHTFTKGSKTITVSSTPRVNEIALRCFRSRLRNA